MLFVNERQRNRCILKPRFKQDYSSNNDLQYISNNVKVRYIDWHLTSETVFYVILLINDFKIVSTCPFQKVKRSRAHSLKVQSLKNSILMAVPRVPKIKNYKIKFDSDFKANVMDHYIVMTDWNYINVMDGLLIYSFLWHFSSFGCKRTMYNLYTMLISRVESS